MKTLLASALVAGLAISGGTQASACTVVAAQVLGNGNFAKLDASACGYTSMDLNGNYSFAEIINILGAIVTGIYGDGNYYEVINDGDNQLGIVVDGNLHTTRVRVIGDGNDVSGTQSGPWPSDVNVNVEGTGSTVTWSIG